MIVSLPAPARRPAHAPAPPTPAAGCSCGTCPFYLHNPSAVEPICSGTNSDCSYCGCARATASADLSGCRSCPIRCGSRTDIADWMNDIGGTLTFDDLTVGGQLPAGLPRVIPQVDGSGMAELHSTVRWAAYAVGLRRVFSPDTHRLSPTLIAAAEAGRTLAEALGLPADPDTGQRPAVVVLGYGEDPLVEGFWTRRVRDRLLEHVAALAPAVFCTPNFSMYGNQPRTEMLLNFRRNLMIAAEAARAGLTAVPNLYWFRVEDLERYLDWITDLGADRPPAIAINLQTFRTDADWNQMALPGLTLLSLGLPPDLPVLITGPSRADRVRTLAGLFGDRMTLTSQNPFQYAQHGALMTDAGRMDVHAHKHDLLRRNLRWLTSVLTDPPTTARTTP